MNNAAGGSGVYLDTASSEPLHRAARDTLLAALEQGYADPRRLHRHGRSSRRLLDNARGCRGGVFGGPPRRGRVHRVRHRRRAPRPARPARGPDPGRVHGRALGRGALRGPPRGPLGRRRAAVRSCGPGRTGRLPLPDGWSAAAGSAHKWGGPAGVGVLLVRKGVRWTNPFPGDDRVDERTSGFENVPAALAAAAALQAVELLRVLPGVVSGLRERVGR